MREWMRGCARGDARTLLDDLFHDDQTLPLRIRRAAFTRRDGHSALVAARERGAGGGRREGRERDVNGKEINGVGSEVELKARGRCECGAED